MTERAGFGEVKVKMHSSVTKLSQWKILGQKVWSFVRGQSEATFFNDTKLSEWKTLGQKVKVKLPSSMTKHSRNAKDLDERGGVCEK